MLIDPPVGTAAERATGDVWPRGWINATPFAGRYQLRPGIWARHTGVDLNLNTPSWNSDAGAPVYAIADGVVTSSRIESGSWGYVIVIEHTDDEGQEFYSRYAHVNHIDFPVVRKGDTVKIGTTIALIGNADGIYGSGHHLHFDISHTKVLKSRPAHWPGDVTASTIRRNYSDPHQFIYEKRNTTSSTSMTTPALTKRVIASALRIRPQPNTLQPEIGWLSYNDLVVVKGGISSGGYRFAELLEINGQPFGNNGQQSGYVALEFLTP